MDSLLTNLADELLVQDITEPSAVLGSLCDDELEAAYDHILEQFALELLIGAAKTRTGTMASSSSTPTTAPSISCKLPSMRSGSNYGDGRRRELPEGVKTVRSACPASRCSSEPTYRTFPSTSP